MNKLGWTVILFAGILMLIYGCGRSDIFQDLDRQQVIDAPVEFTTPLGFTVTTDPGFTLTTFGRDQMRQRIDTCVTQYISCMNKPMRASIELLREHKWYITETTFVCPYTGDREGICNGFWSGSDRFIVLAYSAVFRDGELPLCEHEVAHALGDYNVGHTNLTEQLHKCIIYK